MPDDTPIILAPGAPVSFVIPWADASGPVDLTGFTASIHVVNQWQGTRAAFEAAVTAAVTQENPGEVTVRIGWDDDWTLGRLGRFTVVITPPAGDAQATLPISVHVGQPD